MSTYLEQLRCPASGIDLDFWRAPEGASVPDDELCFLLVPDTVEALTVFEVAQQVHRYQQAASDSDACITRALMATMGGLLPGILLHDHLVAGRPAGTPAIEFGIIGASLYKGPDERHDEPSVTQDMTLDVEDEVVLLIDDLCDRGDTMQHLAHHVAGRGAMEVLTLALYMKPEAISRGPADFYFGTVSQETWIITPRECAETLARRVPVWKQRGASMQECRSRLIDLIGYPVPLVDYYLQPVYGIG
jgi:hypoxanthine phosphoribosyltransferase